VGALFAVIGTYFLSVTEKLTFNAGDVFILLSAIPWSFHVLTIEKAIQKVDSLFLSFCQFFICGVLCLIVAAFTEPLTFSGIYQSWIPIAYGGILSVGLGYTLQVVAQKDAPASHVVILLSLESVFAALSEWIWLGEKLSNRSLLGCTLMFSGVLLAQVRISKSQSNTAPLNER
jgi:drug/metabolite transporter (DMT)-like permease